jgi:hypothetical protein
VASPLSPYCHLLLTFSIPLTCTHKCALTCSHTVNVRKYRLQNDHEERSDLAKRFFIARWERERAESQEREGERGRGLNTPQWDSA